MPQIYFVSSFLAPDTHIACVDINESASAGALVSTIKHHVHYSVVFAKNEVKISQLSLYSLPNPISAKPVNSFAQRVYAAEKTLVSPVEIISENPSWATPGHIQLILRVNTGRVEDALSFTEQAFLYNQQAVQSETHPPSYFASSPQDEKKAQEGAQPIYNGRPVTTLATPVTAYSPELARLQVALRSIYDKDKEPAQATMVLAEKFCRLSMARYDNEKEREAACRPTYHQLLDCKLALQHRLADTRPDGMLSVRLANNSNSLGHPAIIEIKGDMHASDGIVQADHTYTKVATSKEKSHVYNGSCSPAVLLVSIGPYFFIRGAVHVGVPIIQRLAEPIVLGGETYPEANVKAVANAFEALSRAIDELSDFYSTLVPAATWQPSAHLPKPTLKAAPGQAPPLWLAGLKFVDRLDGGLWHPTIKHKNYFRSLYKAKLGDKPVIVKICEHYGEKAHRLLAGEGLAPQLHHCVELMGWGTMVVMDEVTGRDASVAFPVGMPLPASVKEDVKRAMASLHRAGLVFGDLRRPNVMIVPKARRGHGEEDERSTKIVPEEGAMLVDFDWAGDERAARYPVSINDAIRKSGAEAWGLMSHEHDDYMLTVL